MGKNVNILSAIPGVFYRRSSPEKDVYVNEGDNIKTGDIIGLVEVMKTFYEIKAEQDGVIESFLVSDDETVEAGQEIAVLIEQ